MFKKPKLKAASDRSILIEFDFKISEESLKSIKFYSDILLDSYKDKIEGLSPSYSSILIRMKDDIKMKDMINKLKKIFKKKLPPKINHQSKTIKIPVCYEDEFAPDIQRIISYTGYSKDEIIIRHTAANYVVYFIGFSPGFPYIGGMDHSLETPRLNTPRTIVPAGAVAIGGNQTGIYPIESPGGWNIIGRTYYTIFDWQNIGECILNIGSKIEFYSISKNEYMRFKNN